MPNTPIGDYDSGAIRPQSEILRPGSAYVCSSFYSRIDLSVSLVSTSV